MFFDRVINWTALKIIESENKYHTDFLTNITIPSDPHDLRLLPGEKTLPDSRGGLSQRDLFSLSRKRDRRTGSADSGKR